jgi:ubiquitin carboxyl-terminal hydrolase 36/42
MEKKGLKGLFDEIDKNKKKGQGKKTDDDKYKTKPTKPNFPNIVGLNNTSIQYKGLTNYGNICYSNVVMQCLNALKEFYTLLKNIFSTIEELDSIEEDYPILFNMVKLMSLYEIKNTTLASQHIKIIINIFDSSGEQNDAHEFLVFLFDRLNEELLKLGKVYKYEDKGKDETEWEEVKKGGKRMKQTNTEESFMISVIGNIFQGILKHEIESKGKSLSKCSIEPFFVLSLDFGENSIESCFKKFFEKRKVESSDFSDISQKTYVDKLSKVLIVHLKAFYYDRELKKIIKINKQIDYGTTLWLSEDYLSPSKKNYYSLEYELVSVIIHKGSKASEGHYICFCKDDKGQWWSLDDQKILKIDESVFKNCRPYILFYRNKNKL